MQGGRFGEYYSLPYAANSSLVHIPFHKRSGWHHTRILSDAGTQCAGGWDMDPLSDPMPCCRGLFERLHLPLLIYDPNNVERKTRRQFHEKCKAIP